LKTWCCGSVEVEVEAGRTRTGLVRFPAARMGHLAAAGVRAVIVRGFLDERPREAAGVEGDWARLLVLLVEESVATRGSLAVETIGSELGQEDHSYGLKTSPASRVSYPSRLDECKDTLTKPYCRQPCFLLRFSRDWA
jgi:hypothetical protein